MESNVGPSKIISVKKRKKTDDIVPISVPPAQKETPNIMEELHHFEDEKNETIENLALEVPEEVENLKTKLLNLYLQNPKKTILDIPEDRALLINSMDKSTLETCINATIALRNGTGKYDDAIIKTITQMAKLIPGIDIDNLKEDLKKDENLLFNFSNMIHMKLGVLNNFYISGFETLVHMWNNFQLENVPRLKRFKISKSVEQGKDELSS